MVEKTATPTVSTIRLFNAYTTYRNRQMRMKRNILDTRATPEICDTFRDACKVGGISISKALRTMVSIFLKDSKFRETILKEALNQ
jgi:hypothetical protein